MDKKKWIQVLGLVVSAVGFLWGFLEDWCDEKQQRESTLELLGEEEAGKIIEDKVNEILEKKDREF